MARRSNYRTQSRLRTRSHPAGKLARVADNKRGRIQATPLTATSAFQSSEIRDVLRPADGTLVSNQSIFGKNENGNAIEFSRHFARERFITRHAGNAR